MYLQMHVPPFASIEWLAGDGHDRAGACITDRKGYGCGRWLKVYASWYLQTG